MRNTTREQYNRYLARIQELNGISDATKKFSVAPSVQQTLETKIQESSAFLGRINIHGVEEMEGEKIGLGVSGPIASRTDTTKRARETRDVSALDSQKYRCEKTNYDTHIRYQQLDAWAKFPDFQARLRDSIIVRQALDRIMIGWNGVKVADDTDLATNPLLQDVNIGWLQQYRNNAKQRVFSGVKIGKGEEFKNLDAVVSLARNEFLDPWYAEDPNLVVICGRELLQDKYFPLINQAQPSTETLATDIVVSQKRVGNLPAVSVPYFPPHALMVTRLDNLSIYWQTSARRRSLKEVPERDRIENYESSNDAYVIEQYGAGCVVEDIQFADAAPAAPQGGA
ncbi:P2 family phage major capsid protein [Burkholderia pseudomallei]|uniref:phage major capsid protein, P2 family n=1 Tax=Burkholderia TaxID=32008 RepID=UPI00075EC5AD|nr:MULTISPECIES: phage major capsid protein, P2 family [Burkholderia]AOK03292.1 capsid protein [Burkholderia latens]KVE72064.1 capsid protein [Burkholderia vietnamiensis]MBO7758214.1 phage major capsid protein, P2 family [Burkholderia pseudomallei]MCA8312329.1 phage major capsid protein, P2 family [Burkholderia sp. AU28942]CAJ5254737.1 P2 family phage major capsid protein [Burkholderia pseudomallei]